MTSTLTLTTIASLSLLSVLSTTVLLPSTQILYCCTMEKRYPLQNAILKKDTLDKETMIGIHDL